MVEPFPSFFDPRFSDSLGGEAFMRAHCARVSHFSFFTFTPSPTLPISLFFNQLGVKTFAFEPSPESGECFAKIASNPVNTKR